MPEEIKAKITIEADTSGADQAAAALEKLTGLAGEFSSGGSAASDTLAAIGESAGEATKALVPFGDAITGAFYPMAQGYAAVTEATGALSEHGQALISAEAAYKALQEPVGATVEALQAAEAPMTALSERAQTLVDPVSSAGESFVQLQDSLSQTVPLLPQFADSLHTVSEAFDPKQFGLDTFAENMSVFQDALQNPTPFSMIQSYLGETGQTWEDFTSSIGSENTTFLNEMATNADVTHQVLGGMNDSFQQTGKTINGSLEDYQAFTDQFNNAGASFGGTLGNMEESAKSANETFSSTSEAIGGIGTATKEAEQVASAASESGGLGGVFEGIFGGGGITGILNEIAMPLMAVQMIGMAVGTVATGIYNMAAIAEGPGAHGMNTFTGSVDAFNASMQNISSNFSEGFGQGVQPLINMATDLSNATSGNFWQGFGQGFVSSMINTLAPGASLIGQLFPQATAVDYGQTQLPQQMQTLQNNTSLYRAESGSPEYLQLSAQQQVAQTNLQTATMLTEAVTPANLQASDQAAAAQTAYNLAQSTYNAQHPINPYSLLAQAATSNYQEQFAQQYGLSLSEVQQAGIVSPTSAMAFGEVAHITGGGPNVPVSMTAPSGTYYPGGASSDSWGFGGPNTSGWQAVGGGIMSGISTVADLGWHGLVNSVLGAGQGAQDLWGMGVNAWNSLQATPPPQAGCFVAGTHVTLADGTSQTIETLQAGQQVLASDGKEQHIATISATMSFSQKRVYTLTFSDGRSLTLTEGHPFAIPSQGSTELIWKSLNPVTTLLENPGLEVTWLELGDMVYTRDGIRSLVSIKQHEELQTVYNITVDDQHTYYADGVLVHNMAKMDALGPQIADQVGGIQLPHIDFSGMASSIGNAVGGIQLPHIDFSGMASSVGNLVGGMQLPHIDFSSMASSVGGLIGNMQLPHIDFSGMTSSLSGAFSGIQLPHLDLSGITSSLSGAFSGISLPNIPNLAGQITSELGNMVSGISLPNIPNIAGQITGELGNMFTGFQLPNIPNVAGMLSGEIGAMFTGFQLPSLPNIGGMINGALSNMFASISVGMVPGFAGGVENYSGGPAFIAEGGPELVMLPSGSSVYPLSTGSSMSSNLSPLSLGGGASAGAQTANIVVQLDGQTLVSVLGASLMQTVNVGMGKRSY